MVTVAPNYLLLGTNGHLVSNQTKNYLPANIHLVELIRLIKNKSSLKNNFGVVLNNNCINSLYDDLHSNLSFCSENASSISISIKEGFQKTQEDILNQSFDTDYSGTTVCSVFIYGSRLYSVNLGDSRAILGVKESKKWRCISLSKDHKPDDKEERKRILNNNGRVEAFKSISIKNN